MVSNFVFWNVFKTYDRYDKDSVVDNQINIRQLPTVECSVNDSKANYFPAVYEMQLQQSVDQYIQLYSNFSLLQRLSEQQ